MNNLKHSKSMFLDIFRRANLQLNNYAIAIFVTSAFALGYFLSTILIQKIPRKVQYICSGIIMAISQSILGLTLRTQAYYALNGENGSTTFVNLSNYLLPICSFCTALGYGLGFGPVTYSMIGEVRLWVVKYRNHSFKCTNVCRSSIQRLKVLLVHWYYHAGIVNMNYLVRKVDWTFTDIALIKVPDVVCNRKGLSLIS